MSALDATIEAFVTETGRNIAAGPRNELSIAHHLTALMMALESLERHREASLREQIAFSRAGNETLTTIGADTARELAEARKLLDLAYEQLRQLWNQCCRHGVAARLAAGPGKSYECPLHFNGT